MDSQLNQRPFLIIGDLPQSESGLTPALTLDLILAQPGRWHEAWRGHMASRIATSGVCASTMRWITHRRLNHVGYVLSEETTQLTPWGALLLSRDSESLELARNSLLNGIPCAALALPEMDVLVLDEALIDTWMLTSDDSQHKSDGFRHVPVATAIDRIDAIDSSFEEISGTISVGEPSPNLRRVAG